MNPSEWFVHLVGAHFRPPAEAVLAVLPAGCALEIRPEPDNPHDSNALAVWLRTANIPPTSYPQLTERLPGYGTSIENLLLEEEIQLGYVARSEAGEIAARITGQIAPGRLSFSERGKPKIVISILDSFRGPTPGPGNDPSPDHN